MAEIFVFTPRHEIAAAENMSEFITSCREKLSLYEPHFDWNEHIWGAAGVTFGNIDQKYVSGGLKSVLAQPFLDFAKAYVRYRQTHAPNKHHSEMKALKCVERALVNLTGRADPSEITIGVLDAAQDIAREHYKAPYAAGREIAALARFLTDHRLVGRSLDWRSNIKRPTDTVRTGIKAKEKRESKLPNEEAVHAIAAIFASNPTEPDDIFVTSTVAMLLCAPSRISEILELSEDCEVEEMKRDGTLAYGWRFRPKKGGAPMIKWIPDAMVDVAKAAIARVRTITQPAREFAAWIEARSDDPFPHLQRQLGDKMNVSRDEVRRLVGQASLSSLTFKYVAGEEVVQIEDLRVWTKELVVQRHPSFPYIDDESTIKWSERLYCFHRNQLHRGRSVVSLSLWAPDNNALNDRLTANSAKVKSSFFTRHGFNEGRDVLGITSHQFRHLLVTMSHRGGLSTSEIARWRGSKDHRQNRAYNQRSEFELVAMLRENDPALTKSKSEIEIAEQIKMALPVTTAEFNALEKPTAHITELGFCIHDFVMSPCQRFRDCLNCTEQVCVKGDRRLEGLREQLSLVEDQIESAKEGAADGLYGADPWTQIQTQTRDRLKNLIEIMEDPSVPAGALVRLANPREFSPAIRALRANGHDRAAEDTGRRSLPFQGKS
ncbi:MAG: integrase [Sphingomonadaceae bacterium]|mgnify:CR=1 FL=1|nr:integrase [Sphingomonadaceae bacterium]|tara:strand:- start:4659 stop:6641 length:1983 start_codon:yes stop_codon:yes gene_type:complete